MSTSTDMTLISNILFKEKIIVELNNGDILTIPYSYTQRISRASKSDLSHFHLIGNGRGVHFSMIDEDISLKGIIEYKISHDLKAS
jgi:hypothetical protein